MEKEINIKADSLLARNESDFLFTEVDNETVLMNTSDNGYFGLNNVSTDIWKILESQKTVKSLLEELLKLYKVDPQQCERETQQVLKAMIHRNLLTIIT